MVRTQVVLAAVAMLAGMCVAARPAQAQWGGDAWSDAQSIISNFRSNYRPSWRPQAARQRSATAWWAVHQEEQQAIERARQQQQVALWAEQARAAAARAAAARQREQERLAAERRSMDWFNRGRTAFLGSNFTEAIADFRAAEQNWPDGTNAVFVQNLQDVLQEQKTLDWLHARYAAATAQITGPGPDDNAAPLQLAMPPGGGDNSVPLTLAQPGAGDDGVVIAVAPDGSKLIAPRSIAGFEQKGFDAIRVHDWAVALAWYETAQLKDPGNAAVANMVGLLRELEQHDGDPYNYFSGAGVIPPAPHNQRQDTEMVAHLLYDAQTLGIQIPKRH